MTNTNKNLLLLFMLILVTVSGYLFNGRILQNQKRNFIFTADSFTPPVSTDEQSFSENGGNHNCRIWAAISNDFGDSVIINDLLNFPRSLKKLSHTINTDGWGIAYYLSYNDSLHINRSALQAFYDSVFDSIVTSLDSTKPKIILAHVRNCTSGCCCHECETITNPHPFWRYKDGKYWSFVHNGNIDKSLLTNLIGYDYLSQNPLTGSGIPECDPSDSSLVVDSELFFLFLLKHIEEANWNVTDGIVEALVELIINSPKSSMNFIISDSNNLWAFCRGQSLYYIDDSLRNYRAFASRHPQFLIENWVAANDYELVFTGSDDTLTVLDIKSYIPPGYYVIGDSNGDWVFNGLDVTYGVSFLKGIGPAPPDTIDCSSNGLILAAADANGSCSFNGLDIVYSISYFKGVGNDPLPCPDCPPIE